MADGRTQPRANETLAWQWQASGKSLVLEISLWLLDVLQDSFK
jgi:hypothetical protein